MVPAIIMGGKNRFTTMFGMNDMRKKNTIRPITVIGTYSLSPLNTMSPLRRIISESIITTSSSEYSLSRPVAMIKKFWCSTKFEKIHIARAKSPAENAMIIQRCLRLKFSVLKRSGKANLMSAVLSTDATIIYISTNRNKPEISVPRHCELVRRDGLYFSSMSLLACFQKKGSPRIMSIYE